jgi:hypothetical protein
VVAAVGAVVAVVTVVGCIAAGAAGQPLVAQPAPLINEHVDLNIAFGSGVWDVRPYDGDVGGFDYPGGQAVFHVDRRALWNVPGAGFEFVGAVDLDPLLPGLEAYRLPQGQNPDLVYLGIAGYGALPTAQWDRYNPATESGGRVTGLGRWLRLTVASVAGPGDVSVWQSGDEGPTVFVSSASGGLTAGDAVWVVANGHTHYNLAFTRRGLYRLDLRPSGYLGDDGLSTANASGFSQAAAPATIYFNVDPGYAVSGVVASSPRPLRGTAALGTGGFAQALLAGAPAEGRVRVSGAGSCSPAFVLLDLDDPTQVGALTVALNGTSDYDRDGDPATGTFLSGVYQLDDVPATAVIDNSVLGAHPGYELALRLDSLPGSAFDFEFDYSMILGGVRVARVGVVNTPAPGTDVNGDGSADVEDLYWFEQGLGSTDVDGNGVTNDADRAALVRPVRCGEPAGMAGGQR